MYMAKRLCINKNWSLVSDSIQLTLRLTIQSTYFILLYIDILLLICWKLSTVNDSQLQNNVVAKDEDTVS